MEAQVRGVQVVAPHLPGVPPPPQVCPAGQAGQVKVPPQPSPAVPQLMPRLAQVAGTQAPVPHLPGPPPPQVCGALQVPQLIVPLQPSGYEPQE